MKVTLKKLHIASLVATSRSFSQTAKDIKCSPTAVASAISSLEKELGVELFKRHRAQGVVLTEAGKDIIHQADRVLAKVDSFKKRAAAWIHAPVGELRVGCYTTLSHLVMPPALGKFSEQYPNVPVHVYEGSISTIEQQVCDNRVDVVLTFDFGFCQDLVREILTPAPTYVTVAIDSPEAERRFFCLEDLAELPMILFDMPRSRDYYLNLFRQRNLNPKIQYRTRCAQTVQELVARGLGYSLMNTRQLVPTSSASQRLVYRPLENGEFSPNIVLAYPDHTNILQAAETFGSICKSYFRENKHEITIAGVSEAAPWIQFNLST